jgi:hypothetical protein
MDIKEHYTSLKEVSDGILEQSLGEDNLILIAKSHNILFEYSIWLEILKEKPEYNILQTASKELQISIMTLNFGFYSKSFSGLRFFLERSLVAILFSSQEIELKLWEKGERDTYWTEIIDENKGIFSHRFSNAFFPDLKDEIKHFRSLTQKVYRECSEFVHGNNSAIQSLPDTLEYNKILFDSWHNKANAIGRIILFALNLRYLKHISEEDFKKLESINIDNFNSIKPIQELY